MLNSTQLKRSIHHISHISGHLFCPFTAPLSSSITSSLSLPAYTHAPVSRILSSLGPVHTSVLHCSMLQSRMLYNVARCAVDQPLRCPFTYSGLCSRARTRIGSSGCDNRFLIFVRFRYFSAMIPCGRISWLWPSVRAKHLSYCIVYDVVYRTVYAYTLDLSNNWQTSHWEYHAHRSCCSRPDVRSALSHCKLGASSDI